MHIENHKEEVPFSFYEEKFKALDPADAVARLPFATFDGAAFTMELLGRSYRITWPEYSITAADGFQPPLPVQTFLLRRLLEGTTRAWLGTWKTFREMPWGEMYNTPYTGRVLTRAAFTFGFKLPKFAAACERLGGRKLTHGDEGYEFDFFGPFKMQILMWAGDDEFPPSAQVLYTENFADCFAAEDRVVAGDILITQIKMAM
ncbi:MAG: DUF3786 domain-containing protein [Oscillospiraceae bacterium]|nr:DUF3786 domain-containing protein [Oscillospiraceae bacterium]